ncbi:MAG: 5-(carboxyamino)imidazole ribonucleotide mutase [Succinivibrionaceae bacterium]|nr:5-(carboxyamino)imidazole ribonucleotide mutase [Succinivibrionaceae bacterium]
MSKDFVAVLMGSDSDLPLVERTLKVLSALGIAHEVRVTSAHRTPDDAAAYVADAEARGCKVFICAAGLAAHLAGAVAARTIRPVIGIPVDGGPLSGVDALYSTVMMPGGIPVATVAVGKAGATNAGYLAAQVLAVSDPALGQRLREDRAAAARAVQEKNAAVQGRLGAHD